jgi:hypothetical protein
MGKFGWSYPAGCNGTPADEPCGCDCCGREADDCRCPECPTCGVAGDPACYRDHGLTFNADQLAGQREMERINAQDALYDPGMMDF